MTYLCHMCFSRFKFLFIYLQYLFVVMETCFANAGSKIFGNANITKWWLRFHSVKDVEIFRWILKRKHKESEKERKTKTNKKSTIRFQILVALWHHRFTKRQLTDTILKIGYLTKTGERFFFFCLWGVVLQEDLCQSYQSQMADGLASPLIFPPK